MTSAGGLKDDQPTPLPEIHHVGMVVADLPSSMTHWESVLGRRSSWMCDRVDLPPYEQGDGAVEPGYAIGVGMVWLGNTLLELVTPLDDHSLFSRFLKVSGEGLHHLAFWVPSLTDQVARLDDCGLQRYAGNATPGPDDVSWAYIQGDQTNGVTLELMQRDGASERFFHDIYTTVGREIHDKV